MYEHIAEIINNQHDVQRAFLIDYRDNPQLRNEVKQLKERILQFDPVNTGPSDKVRSESLGAMKRFGEFCFNAHPQAKSGKWNWKDFVQMAEEDPKTISRAARRHRRDSVKIQARVECSGEAHIIVLTARGRLVLLDHRDLKTEEAVIALGALIPACVKLLYGWRFGTEMIVTKTTIELHHASLCTTSEELRAAHLTSLAVGLRRRHGIFPPDIRASRGNDMRQQGESLTERLEKHRAKKARRKGV